MSAIRLHTSRVVMIAAIVFTINGRAAGTWSESPALNLRAVFTGAAMTGSSLETTLFRWPTDGERAPLLAALSTTPPQPEGGDRIVLVTDRRIGAHASTSTPAPGAPASAGPGTAAEREFTVIEMRLDGKGSGEAKASLNADVVVDAAAKTLALDGYASAAALLKVTR